MPFQLWEPVGTCAQSSNVIDESGRITCLNGRPYVASFNYHLPRKSALIPLKIPGTKRVDHKRAVKMYERAAGDKTLPSDLRPPDVLKVCSTQSSHNIHVDLETCRKHWTIYFMICFPEAGFRKPLTSSVTGLDRLETTSRCNTTQVLWRLNVMTAVPVSIFWPSTLNEIERASPLPSKNNSS